MPTMNLDDLQPDFRDLIAGLVPDEPLVITKDGEPVATLTRSGPRNRPRVSGSARDKILWIAPDFDAPLEEFRDYME